MEMTEVVYALDDITDRLRVHMMASPLDDIVDDCVNDLQELLERLNEEI